MLPHEDLAPWYGKVVWLYVCRTWRADEPDLEAARIHDRFGVTSWPHLFLIHPVDDRVLRRAGRTTQALDEAFTAAAAEVLPRQGEAADALLEGVRAKRERVLALEAIARAADDATTPDVLPDLDDPDVLVRHRALVALRGRAVPALAARAERLLVGGNDAIRFEVLDWIERNEVAELTPLLVRVFREAGGALPAGNPNVLRGRAARGLRACGDARAIPALATVARAADARNATTRAVVDALGAIGGRGDEAVRARVAKVLLGSWPAAVKPAANGSPTALGRYALRLAESVTKALAATLGGGPEDAPPPQVPKGWSEDERSAHVAAVTAWVREAATR